MKENLPSENNRAYYPTNTDIHNHIDAAKTAIQLSKFDQISMKALYEEWTKSSRPGKYFFRPYIKKESIPDQVPSPGKEVVLGSTETTVVPSTESTSPTLPSISEKCSLPVQPPSHPETPTTDSTDLSQPDSSPPDSNDQFSQTLLWIHQEEWQQNLIRYGNTMSLIDATYQTTKYDLPLFFVTVRTNIGYKVITHFIIQSETTEQILEALNMLRNWNKNWKPPFSLCDYSEAEISAIEQAFPGITIYICDFHREQAWTRWTRDHKNGLNKHMNRNNYWQTYVLVHGHRLHNQIVDYHTMLIIKKQSPPLSNHLSGKITPVVEQNLAMHSAGKRSSYMYMYTCMYIYMVQYTCTSHT